ncbi:MAG: lysophospholipid acyltransferase family protein [Nitrospiria bacterium]
MKQKIEYIAITVLIGFFRTLPYRLSTQIGAFLGRLFCWLDRRHRLIAMDNLSRSFHGEKTDKDLARIVCGVYRNLGISLIEMACLPGMDLSRVKALTQVEGLEHYFSAQDQKKGVILLSAHFGNWEWLGMALSLFGVRMHVVMRPIDNDYLNRMVQAWRSQHGNIVLNKRTETGEIIKILRNGGTVGFLLDQNVGYKKAVFVDFFGRPAATNKGLATIALRTAAPVLPTFIIRTEKGHKVVFEKPLVLPRSGELKKDLVETTALFTKKIETYVHRYPDQWLWLHRRWKTRPPWE